MTVLRPAPSRSGRPLVLLVAVLLPVLVAAAMVPLRSPGTTAIVTLVLVLCVQAAAVTGGRAPAWASAVAAALAFDVLHTTPYGHWRMDDPQQLEILLVFLGVALLVGEIGHTALVAGEAVGEAAVREARVLRLLTLADNGWSADDLVAAAVREVADETGRAVRFDTSAGPPAGLTVDAEGEYRDEHGNPVHADSRDPWRLAVRRGGVTLGAFVVEGGPPLHRDQLLECWSLAKALAFCLTPATARPATADR